MAQHLRAPVTSAEDSAWFPAPMCSQLSVIPASGNQSVSFGLSTRHTHAAHTDAQAEPSGVKSKSVHNLKTQCGVGNGWLLMKHSGCKYGQLSSISRAHIKISSVHF